MKIWEAQGLFVGSPIVSSFCINIENLEEEWDFFPGRHVKRYCKKNYFFCNKELLFAYWRKIGGTFKCYAVDGGKMNYFVFPAFCPLTMRSF